MYDFKLEQNKFEATTNLETNQSIKNEIEVSKISVYKFRKVAIINEAIYIYISMYLLIEKNTFVNLYLPTYLLLVSTFHQITMTQQWP